MKGSFVAVVLLTLVACRPSDPGKQEKPSGVDIGLKEGYRATIAVKDLNNPSSVSFRSDGTLTVCDSGNGRVLLHKDGRTEEYLTGFTTEFWKKNPAKNENWFKLGPLSAVWVDASMIAVTDAGLGDGAETVNFYRAGGDAASGKKSNPVGPTSDNTADKGEGNLTGLSLSKDGKTIFVCGQGSDASTPILKCDVASRKMEVFVKTDEHKIGADSPMDTLVKSNGNLLVLYSGKGGQDDSLLVEWNTKSGKPVAQWKMPGLVDSMGMDFVPGSEDELVVVDNNWALTEVKAGRIGHVKLGKDAAEVTIIADKIHGPVSCAFGPDRKLYVALLGREFDKNQGLVLAISGF